ncbi:MAG: hypothetical protein J5J00_16955 [Deltaproteobacteria bacterium]|nr:hypothetical protein [Deltaproteobacteria bacterium]
MFESMDSFQISFWVCAIAGTSFFALKVLTSLMAGIGHDLDADFDAAPEVAHDGIESSDAAFKAISITSLTGFFMMFGWVGLASYEQAQLGSVLSLFAATAAGAVTMYVTALIFQAATKLSSAGARFDINATVGKSASVYQKIPANGRGRIQMQVADVTHEIDAISENLTEIESFAAVEVVRVVNSDTVSVKRIS